MDYSNLKLPRPNIPGMVIAVILGVVVAVGLYQAEIHGLIPGGGLNLPTVPLETRTVVTEENAVIAAVDKTSPSVVAIGSTQQVVNPFDPFAPPRSQSSTIGTGFAVSDQGVIITNKHVVSDPSVSYYVITRDGKKYATKKIYRDSVLDLAIVQIDGASLKALELGDSSKLKVGQTAIAIGNALGKFTNTVTTGVVSGLGRAVTAGDVFEGSVETLDNLVQTDAAINPGNSGGPLLNSAGQVIGVNVATTEGAQNIGFAIPINTIKPIVNEFLSKGSVSRPFLGIRYRFISRDVAILNEVPQGAYIQEVIDGSPAQKAGLTAGDIIQKINNQPIDSEGKVGEIVGKANIGTKLDMQIWRDGKQLNISATIGESPNQ